MSMTRDQILKCIDDPSILNGRTLGELREILDEFPYFQSAHLLHIRNLLTENNFRYSSQLKIAAVHATDRTVLYHLLNPEHAINAVLIDDSNELQVNSVRGEIPMIELSDQPAERPETPEDMLRPVISRVDIQNWDLLNFELSENIYSLENSEDEKEKSLSESVNEINQKSSKKPTRKQADQKDELISRFIKDNPPFTIRQLESSEIGGRINAQTDNFGEKDEFITETLARIYMNQGLYQKAINAFEKLSLKYPEKSAYFARQIEEVTNLLNR